jgi:hypothetical protein
MDSSVVKSDTSTSNKSKSNKSKSNKSKSNKSNELDLSLLIYMMSRVEIEQHMSVPTQRLYTIQ